MFLDLLRRRNPDFLRAAAQLHRAGELPANSDPAQIAFELNAICMGLNNARQLHADPAASLHARRAVERVLAP